MSKSDTMLDVLTEIKKRQFEIEIGDTVSDKDGEYLIKRGNSSMTQLIGIDKEGDEIRLSPDRIKRVKGWDE